MSKPKKQHYVPQFYLRNFKDKSQSGDIINCFNIKTKKSYQSTINKVAQKKYFYESSKTNIEPQLSQIEYESSKHINNLVKNKKYKYLNHDVRLNLSYYMSIQLIRTNNVREFIKNYSYEIKDEISQELEIPPKFQKLVDELPSKEHIKDFHLEHIKNYSLKFCKYFYYKKWILIKNKTKLNFWTSDNPITIYNPINPPGLLQKASIILFPISPKLCLCLADPTSYSNLNKPTNNDFISNISKPTYFKFEDEVDVNNNNYIQANSCNLTLFSNNCDFNKLDL